MAGMMDGIWALTEAIASQPNDSSSRTQATVTRVDNEGVVWVHIPGGVSETPVNGYATSSVRPGDSVQVVIEKGRANIVGNATSPAIGVRQVDETVGPVIEKVDDIYDTAVEANEVAGEANRIAQATNQHFWTDGSGVHVTYTTKEQFQQEPSGPNQLSNANGILLRDGETYLSAFTPSGVAIYDGQGNDEVNRSAVFDSDGITFYIKKEVLGHDIAFEALDLSAALAKYGVDVSAVMGDLEVTSFRPTEDGWTGSTKAGTESFVTLVGGAAHLLGSTAYGDTGMAGAGFERGLIHYAGGDGKLSMSSEAHAGIGLGEDFEPDSYFADIPSEVESSCGVEVDVNARYTNLHGETIYNGSTPTIRAWSDYLRLEGNAKSHDFKMDDVIDTLLGESTSVYKGDITSWVVDLSDVAYKSGWYWTVAKDGSYAGEQCEVGDLLFAISDRTNEVGQAPPTTDFTILQTNLDVISAADIDEMMRY